ncbi:peptidylprolyl isomerase [Chondromyces apiculatus]|uniref:peptidylprolyl isomerase n=1 Tax=Chondromyces apiculatus TaxID=51 RepID=UPI0012DE1F50|nr:peptidyl-prolyl cis-trans isomerase [Chondromyces apiculatus]
MTPFAVAGPMSPGTVARVGSLEISADAVSGVAAAQNVSPAQAVKRLVQDALFAVEAQGAGDEGREDVDALLARRLLRSLQEEAERAGPVTDEELRTVTERRWLDFDRPEGFRTVHAVVRVPEGADAAMVEKARGVAEELRRVIGPAQERARQTKAPTPLPGRRATDAAADEFMAAAGTVAKQGLEVVIQTLPPVSASGRVLSLEPQQLDATFSRAVSALNERGDIAPIISSPFGLHVVMLLERIPAAMIPQNERRDMIREEVMTERARKAHLLLLNELRRRKVSVVDNVDAVLALVRVEP